MWLLSPAGFPEGSREKSSSSSSRTISQNRRGLSIELLPACPRSRTARRPKWIPRRASMVSGGAAPGERALHACDPSEACKREPCPRPLMLPASIAIVCRLIGTNPAEVFLLRREHLNAHALPQIGAIEDRFPRCEFIARPPTGAQRRAPAHKQNSARRRSGGCRATAP